MLRISFTLLLICEVVLATGTTKSNTSLYTRYKINMVTSTSDSAIIKPPSFLSLWRKGVYQLNLYTYLLYSEYPFRHLLQHLRLNHLSEAFLHARWSLGGYS